MQGLTEIQRQNAEVLAIRKKPVTSASPQFIKDFLEAQHQAKSVKLRSYKESAQA